MKRLLLLYAAAFTCTAAYAQYWKAIGCGTIGPTGVQTLYGDSISNRLLAGGTFLHILNENDTVLGFGQAAWNGSRWDSLATRIQAYNGGESSDQTHWFLRFEGSLYACGFFGFQNTDGTWNNNIARLDELNQRWESLGCNIPFMTSISTLVPKEPQNTLYATGYRGSICGYPESCVFRYDGTAFHVWEPFNQIPQGLNSEYVGTVFDFQGKTYMTCSLPDPVDGIGFVSFLRWNGSNWEHVPGWNTLSPIKDISIHNDTLYVAGTFTLADGGPGNLVAAFSNDVWNDMGGGLFYNWVPMSSVVWDLEWFHGALWASGFFNRAGGVPAHSIAHWNGQQWCVPPGDIRWINFSQPNLLDMTVWRDSLYVCGAILTVDGDTMKQVVQWTGGDAVAECGTLTEMAEITGHGQQGGIAVTPLQVPGSWSVTFPFNDHWGMQVYDATGRKLFSSLAVGSGGEIHLSNAGPGVYLCRATSSSGEIRGLTLVVR